MWTVLILMVVMLVLATSVALLCVRRAGSQAANPGRDARFVAICCFLSGCLASVPVLWPTGDALIAGLTGAAVIALGGFASRLPSTRAMARDTDGHNSGAGG